MTVEATFTNVEDTYVPTVIRRLADTIDVDANINVRINVTE